MTPDVPHAPGGRGLTRPATKFGLVQEAVTPPGVTHHRRYISTTRLIGSARAATRKVVGPFKKALQHLMGKELICWCF